MGSCQVPTAMGSREPYPAPHTAQVSVPTLPVHFGHPGVWLPNAGTSRGPCGFQQLQLESQRGLEI